MSGSVSRKFGVMTGAALGVVLALAACTSGKTYEGVAGTSTQNRDTIFSDGGVGLSLFGASKENVVSAPVAVNAYLWRASLDTISFMPLSSADPFGGVIITDWYSPQQSPDERFKVTVYILDTRLRADGVKVALFKQQRDPGRNAWIDGQPGATTAADIENAILTRARELRIAANTK